MATRAVALDIGTFAVRAAEVAVDGPVADVVRFGQLTLPPGAVVAGEVMDEAQVASTLRRLWQEVGFRSRNVILGIGNPRIIVRQADMPALDAEEIAAALRYESADLIPLPPEDAQLDFQVLEEFLDDEGHGRARLLLAAAERSMLAAHLRALQAAGLRARRVDPVPLALVRALAVTAPVGEPDPVEAIVSVGAGVTSVVVHEGGIPRFARLLGEAGGGITDAIAEDRGIDRDAAEDLKRRLSAGEGGPDDLGVDGSFTRAVRHLAGEIASSIEFFQGQAHRPVDRVIMTGAGSRVAGLTERLAAETGLAVEDARPLAVHRLSAPLDPADVPRAEVNLPVLIGLGMAAAPVERGQRRINLLPVEVTTVREERRQALAAGGALVGLAALLGALWALRGAQVSNARRQAQQDEAASAAVQSQIARLQPVSALDAAITQRKSQVRSALTGDVGWTTLLQQVAAVMPDDVWLTSFQATRSSAASAAGKGGIATVSFSAGGANQTSTARWLLSVGQLTGLTNLWVSSSTAGTNGLTFSSTATVTPAAEAHRQAQYIPGPQ